MFSSIYHSNLIGKLLQNNNNDNSGRSNNNNSEDIDNDIGNWSKQ